MGLLFSAAESVLLKKEHPKVPVRSSGPKKGVVSCAAWIDAKTERSLKKRQKEKKETEKKGGLWWGGQLLKLVKES